MSLKNGCALCFSLVVFIFLAGCGTSTTPSAPHMAAAARFALVANLFSNSISTYAIDPASGQLTPKNEVPTNGLNSRVISVEPSGRFAYVGNVISNNISVFAIDANTGSLNMVGSPVPAGYTPPFTT